MQTNPQKLLARVAKILTGASEEMAKKTQLLTERRDAIATVAKMLEDAAKAIGEFATARSAIAPIFRMLVL